MSSQELFAQVLKFEIGEDASGFVTAVTPKPTATPGAIDPTKICMVLMLMNMFMPMFIPSWKPLPIPPFCLVPPTP